MVQKVPDSMLVFPQTVGSTSGSSLVGHIAAGTGATARTVQTKLRDMVSVKDFGAVGDGVTDDTSAFTAAAASGGVVTVPPGAYFLASDVSAANVHFLIHGTITGAGRLVGATVSRFGANSLAVGRNAGNAGATLSGLQFGGGDTSYGADGVFGAPDGHASWLRFQPTKNESPLEVVLYPTAGQGIAQAQNGTNQIVRTTGSPFTSSWVGKKLYLGATVYKVGAVSDASHLTVTTEGGGAVSFSSTFSETFHVCYVSGTGTCTVTGATVTRTVGDPFVPFITGPYLFKLNGVAYSVAGFTDVSTQTLTAPPTNGVYTYTFETDINDQLTTLRIQKLIGADEENLSLYASHTGYHLRALFAGAGKYRKVHIGSGDNSGALFNQLVAQVNGDLTIGADYDLEAIRVLAQTGVAANRLETQAAPTGVSPTWRARGADATVGMAFDTKGAGNFTFTSNTFGKVEFQIFGGGGTSWLATASDNFDAPTLSANGATANVDIKLAPKGAGRVWLGGWASSADVAVNGYITVKDSGGVTRKLATIA